MTQRLRLAVFTTHPIQYQVPVWRSLAADPELEVRVFFGSDFSVRGYVDQEFGVRFAWDMPMTEGYTREFLIADPTVRSAGQLHLKAAQIKARVARFAPRRGRPVARPCGSRRRRGASARGAVGRSAVARRARARAGCSAARAAARRTVRRARCCCQTRAESPVAEAVSRAAAHDPAGHP